MKLIRTSQSLTIPDKVEVTINGRDVTVKGPRGTLKRSFKHVQCDIKKVGNKIVVEVWWGTTRHAASVRTVCSHINNLMTGVVKGYQYNMRLVYAHFPINPTVVQGGKALELRNFLGQKRVRTLAMKEGVTISRSESVKDQLELTGNDISAVSQTAANIHINIKVPHKDIRKFLDGVYVSEKGTVGDLKPVI